MIDGLDWQNLDWQNLVALGLIGLAVAYLLARAAAVVRRRACGGGCSRCPSSSSAIESREFTIVPVEELVKSAKRW